MEPLLFLVHRIPFPPNKGDKIRSHHLLRYLATRYEVHLGTFVDSKDDLQHVDRLAEYCASYRALPLDPRAARLLSVGGFLSGKALTLAYYRSVAMQEWVDTTIERYRIRRALVFSAAMAQFVQSARGMQTVIDLVDVDSAKWTQYAAEHAWPMSMIYRREGEKLLDYERSVAASAAAVVLVTRNEAEIFENLAPELKGRPIVVENGVDTEYFAPRADVATPFDPKESPLVFSGAMDYWPNIDAVTWFAREVLPQIVAERPETRFYVVGMNPAPEALALATDPHISVTGRVPDIRPYLQHASAAVAPMRIARGIQNKILEAMAMARPVVVSTAAARGLRADAGIEFEVGANPSDFAAKTLRLMQSDAGKSMGDRARQRILAEYNWDRNLSVFSRLLEQAPDRRTVGAQAA